MMWVSLNLKTMSISLINQPGTALTTQVEGSFLLFCPVRPWLRLWPTPASVKANIQLPIHWVNLKFVAVSNSFFCKARTLKMFKVPTLVGTAAPNAEPILEQIESQTAILRRIFGCISDPHEMDAVLSPALFFMASHVEKGMKMIKVGVGETELERDGSVRNTYGEMDASRNSLDVFALKISNLINHSLGTHLCRFSNFPHWWVESLAVCISTGPWCAQRHEWVALRRCGAPALKE